MSKGRVQPRRRGEVVELRFWLEASRRGVIVSKPHDCARYDFIVDCGDRLWRVQVKSTTCLDGRNAYRLGVNARHVKKRYRASDVDLIAAYVIPTQQWYIIPLHEVGDTEFIYLHERSKFAKYLEAWHILLHKTKNVRIDYLYAAAEPGSLVDKE